MIDSSAWDWAGGYVWKLDTATTVATVQSGTKWCHKCKMAALLSWIIIFTMGRNADTFIYVNGKKL